MSPDISVLCCRCYTFANKLLKASETDRKLVVFSLPLMLLYQEVAISLYMPGPHLPLGNFLALARHNYSGRVTTALRLTEVPELLRGREQTMKKFHTSISPSLSSI
jgi:hypothetical protein